MRSSAMQQLGGSRWLRSRADWIRSLVRGLFTPPMAWLLDEAEYTDVVAESDLAARLFQTSRYVMN
jgi:hypothetical protein